MSSETLLIVLSLIAATTAAAGTIVSFWLRRLSGLAAPRQFDRAKIEDTFKAEIHSLNDQLAATDDEEEKEAIKQEIRLVHTEQRKFYRASRELLLSKSLRRRLTPPGAVATRGTQLSETDRELLETAASVVARLEPPKTVDDHFDQGIAFYAAGDYDRALEEYSRALELKPDGTGSLTNRAATLNQLQRYDEALTDLNRSLELAPDHVHALHIRGITLSHLQRYDEALADFNRTLQLDPDYAATLYDRACVYSRMGQIEKSLDDLKEAISRDPKYRRMAREDEDFDNFRSDPTLGPEFQRLVAEPEADSSPEPESR